MILLWSKQAFKNSWVEFNAQLFRYRWEVKFIVESSMKHLCINGYSNSDIVQRNERDAFDPPAFVWAMISGVGAFC